MILIDRMLRRVLLATVMFALAVPLAQADPGNGRFQRRDVDRQNGPPRQPPQQDPYFQRDEAQRFQRRDDVRGGEQQRPQRFSPEERRQLRRDVHDAGRDIYRR